MLPFLPFFLAGILLALIGWGGLAFLVLNTLPTLEFRWLFFFCWSLAASGTALPFLHFLHRRFPSVPPVHSGILVREALFVALYVGILAWLQLGRMLTPALGVFIAGGLLAIELIIRMRERSQFKPKEDLQDG